MHPERLTAGGGSDAPTIARVIVKIVRSKSPRLRHWAGSDARLYGWVQKLAPDFLTDRIMRKKFVPDQ